MPEHDMPTLNVEIACAVMDAWLAKGMRQTWAISPSELRKSLRSLADGMGNLPWDACLSVLWSAANPKIIPTSKAGLAWIEMQWRRAVSLDMEAAGCNIVAVIHHRDRDTTVEQAAIALDSVCWGAAVICMDGTLEGDMAALDAACAVRLALPGQAAGLSLGFNGLAMSPARAFLSSRDSGLDFTWVDDPGVRSGSVSGEGKELVEVAGHGKGRGHLLFAGAGFKTHGCVTDPEGAARAVNNLGWVATTSGPATGVPPSAAYLEAMSRAIEPCGNQDAYGLAVASGITPENAPGLLPYVDWAFVATGVSKDFHTFDPDRLRALATVARNVGQARLLRQLDVPGEIVAGM